MLLLNASKAIVRDITPGLAFRLSLQNHFWVELKVLDLLVDPKRDAIDVGANTGKYVRALSQLVPHVYAIEPNPHVAQLLKSGLDLRKATVIQKAVSDSNGSARLLIPADRWGMEEKTLRLLRERST